MARNLTSEDSPLTRVSSVHSTDLSPPATWKRTVPGAEHPPLSPSTRMLRRVCRASTLWVPTMEPHRAFQPSLIEGLVGDRAEASDAENCGEEKEDARRSPLAERRRLPL